MAWSAAIFAAIKALPELVTAVRELRSDIIGLANARTTAEIINLKKEMAATLEKIEEENDPERMLDHIRRLNDVVSR